MVAQHCTLWGEDPSFVIMSGFLLLTHTKPETTELSTDYTFQCIPCVLMLITLMKDKCAVLVSYILHYHFSSGDIHKRRPRFPCAEPL